MKSGTTARCRRASGFTLLELIVGTAVLAILLQIAIPAMSSLLASWQRDAATRTVTNHLVLARSEAIRWSRRVVMCSSEDGIQCAPSSHKEWTAGWLVFQDLDGNNLFSSSDKLIAVSQSVSGIQRITGNASAQRFVFLPTGMMSSTMATLEVVPRTGKTQKITVNRVGRVRLSFAEPA